MSTRMANHAEHLRLVLDQTIKERDELLKALKGIIDYADRDVGEIEDLTRLGDDRAELDEALGSLAFAHDAIRKAEGGAA